MTTLPLYTLLHDYLHHCWNVSSISSSILSVRDTLFANIITTETTTTKRKKIKTALYPTYIKKQSDAAEFFTTEVNKTDQVDHRQKNLHSGAFYSVTPRYRAPRKPIVLCHGLHGFDRIGPELLPSLQVHYWNEIEKALYNLGAKVIVTRVPKTESISNRAHALHSILNSFMVDKDVNLIAHSMGGLDCRYLLSHMKQRTYHVSSLTTVCTPHRGSPVADWFRDKIGLAPTSSPMAPASSSIMTDLSLRRSDLPLLENKTTTTATRPLLAQWLDTPAYSNLTTSYCTQHFNPTTPDDPSVSYYSYTAKSIPQGSSLLDLPGQWVQQIEGDNDGVVSVESGKWGQHVKTIDDADHWDFTGKSVMPYRWRAKPLSDFDRSLFYVELANHLYEQGH